MRSAWKVSAQCAQGGGPLWRGGGALGTHLSTGAGAPATVTGEGEASRLLPDCMSATTPCMEATMPPRPEAKPGTKEMAESTSARLMQPMMTRAEVRESSVQEAAVLGRGAHLPQQRQQAQQ